MIIVTQASFGICEVTHGSLRWSSLLKEGVQAFYIESRIILLGIFMIERTFMVPVKMAKLYVFPC